MLLLMQLCSSTHTDASKCALATTIGRPSEVAPAHPPLFGPRARKASTPANSIDYSILFSTRVEKYIIFITETFGDKIPFSVTKGSLSPTILVIDASAIN